METDRNWSEMKSEVVGETWVCLKASEKNPLEKPVASTVYLAHNKCDTLLIK